MPLPQDSNNAAIQVLAPGTSIVLSPNASSVSGAIPNNSFAATPKVVYISASGDVWLKFGTSTVTASAAAGSVYMPGGVLFFALPSGTTHIAAFAAAAQTVCVAGLG